MRSMSPRHNSRLRRFFIIYFIVAKFLLIKMKGIKIPMRDIIFVSKLSLIIKLLKFLCKVF